MDNRQFNVNGEGQDMLLRALELACMPVFLWFGK